MPDRVRLMQWPSPGWVSGPPARLYRLAVDDWVELGRHRGFLTTANRLFGLQSLQRHQALGPVAVFSYQTAAPRALIIVHLGEFPFDLDPVEIYVRPCKAIPGTRIGRMDTSYEERHIRWALKQMGLEDEVPTRWANWEPVTGEAFYPDISSWQLLGLRSPLLEKDSFFFAWIDSALKQAG